MTVSDGSPKLPGPTGGLAGLNHLDGPVRDLLAQNDFFVSVFEETFRGDALDAKYPTAKTNGASAAVTFTEHNAQGFLDFVTGTDDDGYAGQGLGMQYTGDRGVLAEFLFETPASIATYKLEVALTDADDDAGGVSGKSGPTMTAGDFAGLVFDTDDDTNTTLITVKDGGTPAAVEQTDFDLAASTVYYATIRIIDDNVWATIQGVSGTNTAKFTYANATAGAGIQGGTALTPWFFTQARAGTASRTTKLYKYRMTTLAW
ncbi:MAG: hypothetical protein QF638_02040 [Acidimicrobiales bacterium]|jgi:hypothetical protein|nr:hypothetical protein [Acidimicrobiales bacterium]